jgi:sterol desaturase/sphingolipid hydroxylase (fatty acid hydroxylase superfamily)
MESLLLLISTPLMVILILGEMIYSHFHKRSLYTKGDTFINLVCTSWNFINDLIFRGFTLVILGWIHQFAPFNFASKDWVYWVLLFLGQDLAYYILHYADHYVRFFWASHVTHHSSEKFNFTVAIRSSVFQPFYRFIFYAPLALFGFEALDIVFMYALCQVYGFWVHTELVGKLHPVFEYLFVTPSHHRVHHGSNPLYLDRNMGMVLIIWDRFFGTFTPEAEQFPVKYGLTKNLERNDPLHVVFSEWAQMIKDIKIAPDLKSSLMYVFGPPGWSHDGSRKTSAELKEDWQRGQNQENQYLIENNRRTAMISIGKKST